MAMPHTPREKFTSEGIRLYSPQDFVGMRTAGQVAAEILDNVNSIIAPGVATKAIDDFIADDINKRGIKSATVDYKGYRHSSCISVNHVVCHGIPSDKVLKLGDIVNIDVTVIVDGWFGDSSRMYCAGPIKRKAQRLIHVTHHALLRGINAVSVGGYFGDIGAAIQAYVESHNMAVVRDFCGHGIGRQFHAPPNILHYGKQNTGIRIEAGMFFTIEPMVNLGTADTKILADGWTAVTRDKSLSAQFEHSVGVSQDGVEVFTLSPGGMFFPQGAL